MGNLLDRFFDWIDSWFDSLDNEELDDYGYEEYDAEQKAQEQREAEGDQRPKGDETGNC
jgi:hypothetical protein